MICSMLHRLLEEMKEASYDSEMSERLAIALVSLAHPLESLFSCEYYIQVYSRDNCGTTFTGHKMTDGMSMCCLMVSNEACFVKFQSFCHSLIGIHQA